jgi:type I restriction enzyme S subunit
MSETAWRNGTLGEVADLCLGKMLDQSKNRGLPTPYLANVNVRWGEFVLDDLRVMRFEQHERDRYGLKYGDIVMCEGGAPGRSAIWKEQVPGMMIQKALHRIRPKAGLDHGLLYYSFRNIGLQKGFDQYFTGATIKHLPGEKLAKVEVPIPPLPIQRRIAGILSAYDDLIENSQRRIKILEEMARRLYREWFVYFRFPGHEDCRLVESPLGEIPEGWDVKSLGDIAVVNRSTINMRNPPNRLGYIDIASVSPGRIESITEYLFSEAPGRARRIVSHGDVLWSCVRPNRRSHAQVMYPEENTIASTGFAVLTALKVPVAFLYQATTTDEFVAYLANNATGAAYPAVTAPTFENAKLVVPKMALSQRFGELTISMAEEVHVIQRQVDNLRRTRDLLLPRLLSGQIDVEALSEPVLQEVS